MVARFATFVIFASSRSKHPMLEKDRLVIYNGVSSTEKR
jgi:hypothetical protein